MTRRLAPIALLLLVLTLRAETPIAPPRIIPLKSVDPVALLPLPPAKGSREEQADLAAVLAAQATRTDAEVARAKAEHELTIDDFADPIGPWFTSEKLPATHTFITQLLVECKEVSDVGKDTYKRPRPFVADKRVHPLFNDSGNSYPSGHATRGILVALVLAEALPDLKDQLYARGQQIGWDRVIAGGHYPSDVYNGRVLGQALAHAALNNPAFNSAFEKARIEIQSARKAAAK